MLIWLYKWIMIEYLDNRSKGTIVIINEKFIKSVSKKHFGQLKGAIDMVNQAKVEEMEDEQILMLAESDKNKYEMPETNVENLAYESKMINIVIGKVHQIINNINYRHYPIWKRTSKNMLLEKRSFYLSHQKNLTQNI